MLYTNDYNTTMDSPSTVTEVRPEWNKRTYQGPFRIFTGGNEILYFDDWVDRWETNHLGIMDMNEGDIYRRLRNGVNRHTNWYQAGYDDMMNQGRRRDQAYSPFVASSYEMSKSDHFVSPCYTIPCNGDVPARHWKHYMFIFKIHRSAWYNTTSLKEGEALNFDKHWIDETTFGTDNLAKTERAFDRLGTALEHELDSILYLHKICSDGSIEGDGHTCN